MKPINSLKHALQKVRVENSDVKLKPVDAVARRVVLPCPWWAEPIPEAPTVSIGDLQDEVKNLRSALSEARRQLALKDEKINFMKKELTQNEAFLRKERASNAELSLYVKKLLS